MKTAIVDLESISAYSQSRHYTSEIEKLEFLCIFLILYLSKFSLKYNKLKNIKMIKNQMTEVATFHFN